MSLPPMVVVDTSVAIKWFFDEPHSERALYLRDAFRDGHCRMLAPDLIYPEFANVVWKRVLFNRLDIQDGATIIASFTLIPFEIVSSLRLLARAYLTAIQHKQSIYDSLFLTLSLEANAELVTGDEPFYQAMHPAFPCIHWIGEWPSRSS